MSEIIELIKVVRERTGAGLMDCKNALKESGFGLPFDRSFGELLFTRS